MFPYMMIPESLDLTLELCIRNFLTENHYGPITSLTDENRDDFPNNSYNYI